MLKFMKETKMFSSIKNDLPSSIVVFFVALPLCLGIALASGAPLMSGIIAGIVGGILVGALSGSNIGVSGPAAGLAVIVLNAITELKSFELFLAAVVIAGIIQIILGLIKAGIIGYYFPSSVIKGMLSGIGIIIILKQIPHAVGYDKDYEGDMDFQQADGENTFSELINILDYVTPGAVIVTLVSLFILLLWDLYLLKKHKVFSLIQGSLVAVAFGVVYQIITSAHFPALALSSKQLVNVPALSGLSDFTNQIQFPDFSAFKRADIYIIGFTIAVVASLETLLCVEATDKLDPAKRVTPTNKELIAQGAGNMLSGLIGGLPITQVIVRSSANIQSGGKTKLSAIMHGIWLLLSIVTIPYVLNLIPLAVLASILFIVGYKLAKPSLFKQMFNLGKRQFYPFVVTIIGIVFTDLLKGIALGLIVAIFIILKNSYKNSHFMHINTSNGVNHVNIKLAEEVTFFNKGAIMSELKRIKEDSIVTIDLSESVYIDYDVVEIINNFKSTASNRNIEVSLITKNELKTADY
jgi:MFS superfamily sulfate permease-like transporter